ncbi:MAG: hypothetical protein JSV76_06660 [Candidatus Bathyarchaeota archaeon]|nr:MAG: hypothetical protein JSV76_06660 [Candidatus Bathyarchaeota archaeon]
MNPLIHLVCSMLITGFIICARNAQRTDVIIFILLGVSVGTLIDLDHVFMILINDKQRAVSKLRQCKFRELYLSLEKGQWGANIVQWRLTYLIIHSITCTSICLVALFLTENALNVIVPNVACHYVLDIFRLISRARSYD